MFHVKHHLISEIMSTDTSAGVTPLMRMACPIEAGRTRASFSRASLLSDLSAW